MTEHPSDALSAYLDDELDAGARAGIDAHLASCAACRSVMAELDELRTRAGAWREAEVSPTMDLWPGIAARLEPRRANVVAWHRRRWSVGVAELAVAASLVAGLSATLLWRGGAAPAAPAAGPAPIVAQVEPTDVPDVGVTRVVFADAQFDAAVVDLERVLREQRDRLNPRTVLGTRT